jgi:hypothetical protein
MDILPISRNSTKSLKSSHPVLVLGTPPIRKHTVDNQCVELMDKVSKCTPHRGFL